MSDTTQYVILCLLTAAALLAIARVAYRARTVPAERAKWQAMSTTRKRMLALAVAMWLAAMAYSLVDLTP